MAAPPKNKRRGAGCLRLYTQVTPCRGFWLSQIHPKWSPSDDDQDCQPGARKVQALPLALAGLWTQAPAQAIASLPGLSTASRTLCTRGVPGMLTGCSRFILVCILSASGVLPLYMAGDYGEGLAIGAWAGLRGCGATAVSAGGCCAVYGWPVWDAEGTTALVTWSRPFQPFFSWQVTTKIFWPGAGWPKRAVYSAVISHWPLTAGPNRPR